jgi:multidrug resistance efflux pump
MAFPARGSFLHPAHTQAQIMIKESRGNPNEAGSRRIQQWRLRRLLINWPLFSWLGLTALCLVLYVRSMQYGIITATAQSIQHEIAPLQMARVAAIHVQIGDHVTKGQELVQLDTTLIDLQLAEAEATMAIAQNTMAGYQGQMLGLVRTVENEILRSQHELELEKSQMASAIAKLDQLHSIQAERDKQFKANLISEELAVALRPEIADMEREVAAYPPQIERDEKALEDQRKHRTDLQKTLRIGQEDDITKAIAEKAQAETKVLENVVEMRKRERASYTLRAETDGMISDVHLYPGVVATAGASVMTMVSKSDLIIGYLPEIRLGRVKIDDHGYAFRAGRPPIRVRVVSVVEEINPLPVQLSPISTPLGAAMRSQKIVFRTEESSDIVPGEKVEIRIENNLWAKAKHYLAGLSL